MCGGGKKCRFIPQSVRRTTARFSFVFFLFFSRFRRTEKDNFTGSTCTQDVNTSFSLLPSASRFSISIFVRNFRPRRINRYGIFVFQYHVQTSRTFPVRFATRLSSFDIGPAASCRDRRRRFFNTPKRWGGKSGSGPKFIPPSSTIITTDGARDENSNFTRIKPRERHFSSD